jgi:hypothetical protein
MDSATSASPGLTVASAADGLGSAAEGPRVASTLALVMLLIGESLPDHLREKYAPAPNPRTVLMNAARNLGLTVRSRSSSVVFHHEPSVSRMVC